MNTEPIICCAGPGVSLALLYYEQEKPGRTVAIAAVPTGVMLGVTGAAVFAVPILEDAAIALTESAQRSILAELEAPARVYAEAIRERRRVRTTSTIDSETEALLALRRACASVAGSLEVLCIDGSFRARLASRELLPRTELDPDGASYTVDREPVHTQTDLDFAAAMLHARAASRRVVLLELRTYLEDLVRDLERRAGGSAPC